MLTPLAIVMFTIVIMLIIGAVIVTLRATEPIITDRQLQRLDFTYLIEFKDSVIFFDISTPALTPVEVVPGIYELVCVPTLDNIETFWWSLSDREYGIQPLALKVILDHGQAKWLKKPATHS